MGPAFESVRQRLRAEGRLTFAAFMAEALHGPDGYYTRRPRLGGAEADFFTSPELHPAFGALLGRLAWAVWDALDRPDSFDLVEHGPGTGVLCRDLLTWADHDAADFARTIRYRLLEVSEPLRATQRATLSAAGLLDGRVTWDEGGPVRGLSLANEVVDALPVHAVVVREGGLLERYVTLDGDSLTWQEDAPSTPALAAYFERLSVRPGEGCLAEVNLAGVEWAEQVADSLDAGALLVLDYGYPAAELYAPERRFGTLLTYRQHQLGSDPLQHVGLQDITAHIDFTSLARAGERRGLETVGLISQASLLRRLGLDIYLQRLDRMPLRGRELDANRRALLALAEPDGLGRIQGLLQTRQLAHFSPFAYGKADDPGRNLVGGVQQWLPALHAGQMRLTGPLDAEGFLDLEEQWQELLRVDADIGPLQTDHPG